MPRNNVMASMQNNRQSYFSEYFNISFLDRRRKEKKKKIVNLIGTFVTYEI
jgi:hypothetical protein